MKPHLLSATLGLAMILLGGATAHAQDAQERIIKFGHLNNADHPVSFGVKRFAEVLAAKSGGKLTVTNFPLRRSATKCSSSRTCKAV